MSSLHTLNSFSTIRWIDFEIHSKCHSPGAERQLIPKCPPFPQCPSQRFPSLPSRPLFAFCSPSTRSKIFQPPLGTNQSFPKKADGAWCRNLQTLRDGRKRSAKTHHECACNALTTPNRSLSLWTQLSPSTE